MRPVAHHFGCGAITSRNRRSGDWARTCIDLPSRYAPRPAIAAAIVLNTGTYVHDATVLPALHNATNVENRALLVAKLCVPSIGSTIHTGAAPSTRPNRFGVSAYGFFADNDRAR
jgi:hypothetical protein